MIVEDERVIALDLEARLNDMGYIVVGNVSSGQAAVAAAEQDDHDLVVMDIQLSGSHDGIAAARQIRVKQDIPVLFLTAFGDEATLQRAQETEPYGFLIKPVDDRDLRVTIETALGRREAERRINESESRLQRATKAGKVGLWEWDLVTNTVYYSQEWKRQIGCEEAEIGNEYEEWHGRVHPGDLDRVLAQIENSLKEPWPEYQSEFRFRHKNGSYRWMLAQASLEKDRQGKPMRLVGSHIDITPQKEHEFEIERLSRLYLALSQVNQLITRVTTREELLEGVCRELVRFGRLRMAWIGQLDKKTKVVTPVAQNGDAGGYVKNIKVRADDSPEGRGPTGISIREGRPVVCNDFVKNEITKPWRDLAIQHGIGSAAAFPIRLDGEIFGSLIIYASDSGFFQDKEVMLFEEAAMDVSFALDHLEQESRKQQAERNYQTIFHKMLNGFALHEIICDGTGKPVDYRFLAVNPSYEKMTGLKASEIVGRTVLDVTPGLESQLIGTYGRVALTGEPAFFENYSAHLKKHFEVAAFRPNPNQFACIVSDVTQRKLLEDQLRQTQKLESIGQLAGGVAHDFNNILSAIMIQLSFLQNNERLDKDTQESLKELMEAAKRAANLTRQLLMFSRRSVLDVKVLDMNEVVANLLKMLGRLIGEHISLRFDRNASVPPVLADPGMLEQVLVNLAVNARDAMPKGGRLTIGIEQVRIDAERVKDYAEVKPGQFVCLSVADTGFGMDESTRKRIFEPFFTTKEQGKGTGLGLATVHGIVAQHKGWVEVESTVGQGSVFKVFLPATVAESKAVPEEKLPLLRGRETILFVEDDVNVRRMVAQGMRLLGYQVIEAADGREARQLWQEYCRKIDLLFTDMVMPEGISGLELAEEFRAAMPHLKIIISSGYSAEMAENNKQLSAGIHYLAKPYEIELLSTKIRECLDSPIIRH